MKAKALILNHLTAIASGHLLLELPDGTAHHFGDDSKPLRLKINTDRFFTRLLYDGSLGFGEAWTAADCDTDQLTEILELFVRNMPRLEKRGFGSTLGKRLLHLIGHARNRNNETGSERNIRAHYDLGNDFYRLFLDAETMHYSCALFESPEQTLAAAQKAKLARIIELAQIGPEHHVLEIGCGWGGFAIEAARQTGCRVTGITLSREQHKWATARVAEAGLQDKVSIDLRDYRKMQGTYDRIVSIEMLEAVGHAYYGRYFAACDRLLKPEGRTVLQVITITDQRYSAYRSNPDWIQKHIFPGGMLPSLTELAKAMTTHSRLIIEHLDNIGPHYAETLRRWRKAFQQHSRELLEQGFDQTFQRKWLYYLSYCEAGFQTRYTNDLHLVLTRPISQP